MTPFISSHQSIGLERSGNQVLAAQIRWQKGEPELTRIFSLKQQENVKQLYIGNPVLATGLEGQEVLVRSITLPLVKDKEIQAALPFQVEPLLPYPIDQALLTYQKLNQSNESSSLTLTATRKETLQSHLEEWHTQHVEPEQVFSVPLALLYFGNAYVKAERPFIILHVESQNLTGVLIKNRKLIASFTQPEISNSFLIISSIESLKKQATKLSYVLFKELNGEVLEGIVFTGTLLDSPHLYEELKSAFQWPLLNSLHLSSYSSLEMQRYAVPIGLALATFAKEDKNDFRQNEWIYPYPWKRLKQPLFFYILSISLLTLLFYFFGQSYLHHQEYKIKQSYVDLLGNRNKTYDQFEVAFLDKNPEAKEKVQGEVVPVEQLNHQDLIERLNFFQKEVQSNPESFPLFAHTPRVSDVLAWLSQHPVIVYQDEKGQWLSRLKIENFSYVMVKRPTQNKKQEKYQIKIELELSSSTPKWAREFHDALIAPNSWVDPKGEVKWSSNRGRYKTSFYLKDKTLYPNL